MMQLNFYLKFIPIARCRKSKFWTRTHSSGLWSNVHVDYCDPPFHRLRPSKQNPISTRMWKLSRKYQKSKIERFLMPRCSTTRVGLLLPHKITAHNAKAVILHWSTRLTKHYPWPNIHFYRGRSFRRGCVWFFMFYIQLLFAFLIFVQFANSVANKNACTVSDKSIYHERRRFGSPFTIPQPQSSSSEVLRFVHQEESSSSPSKSSWSGCPFECNTRWTFLGIWNLSNIQSSFLLSRFIEVVPLTLTWTPWICGPRIVPVIGIRRLSSENFPLSKEESEDEERELATDEWSSLAAYEVVLPVILMLSDIFRPLLPTCGLLFRVSFPLWRPISDIALWSFLNMLFLLECL